MAKRGKKETRFVIWELDSSFTLDNIIKNLSLDYNIEIDYLKDINIGKNDKTLNNGWIPAGGKKGYEKKVVQVAGEKISYVHAQGYYEKSVGKDRAIINNGTILPRNFRIFNRSVDAIFFDLSNKIYVVVAVSISEENRVRSILFGQGRGTKKKEEWKKVNYTNVMQFKFDSKFFYWLLSKKGTVFNAPNDPNYKINLSDVSAVAQLTDKEEYDSKSQGSNVLGSLPALSGLGSNQSVYEAGFTFKLPNMEISLRIADDSTCYINLDDSRYIKQNGEWVDINQEYATVIMSLYSIVLLNLKLYYNLECNNKNWTSVDEEQQRKNWALFVIRELCNENNINLNDIMKTFGVKLKVKEKSISTSLK